ncbi:MAG: hypothetical protein J6D33_10715 [Turicibacter sp.]|nr:hypothetical protein [Turicibacter sp.]
MKNRILDETVSILKSSEIVSYDFIYNEPLIERWLSVDLDSTLNHAVRSNLIPFGEDFIMTLSNDQDSDEMKQKFLNLCQDDKPLGKPISYEGLESLGYTFNHSKSAFENILNHLKVGLFKERGLSHGKKEDLEVNFNVFSEYLLTRMYLYRVSGNYIAYDFLGKKYCFIEEDFLKARCKDVLHEAQSDIWRPSYGNHVLEFLSMNTPKLSHIEETKEYLNLKNGFLNLSTFELILHTPDILSFVQLPIEYDVEAQCPVFMDFIYDIFENDEQRVKLVQEILGYCLTTDTNLQQFFIFYGSGSNGKGVLSRIFQALCGKENCSSATLEELNRPFGKQVIKDKRLNISAETDSAQAKMNTQTLKMLTGEDTILIESKFKDPYSIRPYAKLIILANHYPNTDDRSEGYYRRCVFIPFNKQYVKQGKPLKSNCAYQDPHLEGKLMQELDGIFVWALEGYRRLVDNGYTLTFSKESEKVKQDYLQWLDPMMEFISERLNPMSGNRMLKETVFDEFNKWVKKNQVAVYYNVSTRKFWLDFSQTVLKLREFDISYPISNGKRYISGIEFSQCA